MKTLKNLGLFLSLLLMMIYGVSTAMAQATVAIDCGSTSSYTASDGTVYSADTYFSGGEGFTATTTTSGPDPTLYKIYHFANAGSFTYTIPVANGNYVVHLKYAEMNQYQTVGARVFNVAIQGTTVASNFDITAIAGTLTPLDEPYNVTVTTGSITITETSVTGNAELAAILIQSGPAFTDGPATTTATVGTFYSFTYTASGSPAPTFTLVSGSSLPPGLSLSSSGVLSGTPTVGGVYAGAVSATNSGGSVSQAYTITVNQAPAFTDGPAPSTGTVGTVYSGFTYTASGYPTPTFSKTAGTLPPGLTLTSAGVLSGTPSTAGTYSGTITASNGIGANATQNFNITIASVNTVVAAIDCGSTSAYTASDGTVYSADTYFSGGAGFTATTTASGPDPALYQKYHYSTSSFTYTIPLTNGNYTVHLKYAEMNQYQVVGGRVFNVIIQGTTVASNFDIMTHVASLTPLDVPYNVTVTSGTLTITQTNVTANSELAAIVVIGSNAVAPTISGTALTGSVGNVYNFTYTVTGIPTPTCSVTSGSLPPGLSFSSTGVISGYPTTAGTYSGTITASNGIGSNATDNFNITIQPMLPGTVVAAINCGSTSSYTSSNSIVYSADTYFSGGTATTVSGSPTYVGLGLSDTSLFKYYRSGACTYTIPGLANGTYVVALELCETNSSYTAGSRQFNVSIQGTQVATNYDIMKYDTTLYTPIYLTYNAVVASGTLTIALSNGAASVPCISAILVRTVPTTVTKIAVGEYTDFFLVNGNLLACGSNRDGEGGQSYPAIGNLGFPATPINVTSGVTFTDVGCGGYQSIALDNGGNVWAWGGNFFGQQGNGTVDNDTTYYLPTKIALDNNGSAFNNVKAISCGFNYGAALKNDGSVWVWGLSGVDTVDSGYDSTGIIGNGDPTSQTIPSPRKVTFPAGTVITQISAGVTYIAALDSSGNVWTWGGATVIQNRGNGNSDCSTPTKLTFPSGTGTITKVFAGWAASYAIDSNKNLFGWGYLGSYLGLGGPGNTYHPTATPIAINFFTTGNLNGHVVDVKMSQVTTHVLRDDGTLWCWGDSVMGAVGDGTMINWATYPYPYSWDWGSFEDMVWQPVQVMSNVSTIYANPQSPYVFTVKSDGTMWSWGRGKGGYLGNGVVPGPANFISSYPDHWDVATPAQVQPY